MPPINKHDFDVFISLFPISFGRLLSQDGSIDKYKESFRTEAPTLLQEIKTCFVFRSFQVQQWVKAVRPALFFYCV